MPRKNEDSTEFLDRLARLLEPEIVEVVFQEDNQFGFICIFFGATVRLCRFDVDARALT